MSFSYLCTLGFASINSILLVVLFLNLNLFEWLWNCSYAPEQFVKIGQKPW